jgi:hypothetical protein
MCATDAALRNLVNSFACRHALSDAPEGGRSGGLQKNTGHSLHVYVPFAARPF